MERMGKTKCKILKDPGHSEIIKTGAFVRSPVYLMETMFCMRLLQLKPSELNTQLIKVEEWITLSASV